MLKNSWPPGRYIGDGNRVPLIVHLHPWWQLENRRKFGRNVRRLLERAPLPSGHLFIVHLLTKWCRLISIPFRNRVKNRILEYLWNEPCDPARWPFLRRAVRCSSAESPANLKPISLYRTEWSVAIFPRYVELPIFFFLDFKHWSGKSNAKNEDTTTWWQH